MAKIIKIENPCKPWWPGDPRVEPYMSPIAEALDNHLPKGKGWTEIYNRAYEAVFKAIEEALPPIQRRTK